MTTSICGLIPLVLFLGYVVLGIWLNMKLLQHRKPDAPLTLNVLRRGAYLEAGHDWLRRLIYWSIGVPFVLVGVLALGSLVCRFA